MEVRVKNKIALSLDVDSGPRALEIFENMNNLVGVVKLGPRLVLREGPHFVTEFAKRCPVFLDFKFFDIPSTVLSAVEAAFEMGATFVTVHAGNGPETLRALRELECQLSSKRRFQILVVTMLTSFCDDNLPSLLSETSVSECVESFTADVVASGLSGLVCSGQEVSSLKARYPSLFCVVPGVRFAQSHVGISDQKRLTTPQEAISLGADLLVMGRSLIEDPQGVELLRAWQSVG